MKRVVLFLFFAGLFSASTTAQNRVLPNRPFSTLKTNPGFITINELGGGYGLAGTSSSYSEYYFGFTTINGYQINKNFILAGGTGIYVYNSGVQIPFFLDFRYAFRISRITPYLFADGGMLLKVAEIDYSEVFINPGAGVRYAFSRNLAVNLSLGLMTQVDGDSRASFINLKAGVVYKF